jgi:kinesin family protein 1
LSSFGNVHPLTPGEHIYATEPVSDFKNEPIIYNYEQPLKMVVSPAMMEVLTNGMLTFEVFGRAKRCVLEDMEQWDDYHERSLYHGIDGNSLPETSTSKERRSENELVAEEKHDVVA